MKDAHDLCPHVCPSCLKRFDRKYKLKTHMKRKKHGQFDSPEEKAMRAYNHDRLAQIKRAEKGAAKCT